VVSLLTPAEASELGLQEELRLAGEEGLELHSLPIPDYGVPPSRGRVDELIAHLASALAAGRSVAVHCRQGIGRSSLVVAALLVHQGVEPGEALRRVEKARGRPVPDTDEQREWVQRFASESLVGPSGATRALSR
jgi:protein-tyrosine phosphatase